MRPDYREESSGMFQFARENAGVLAVLSVSTLSLLASRYLDIGGLRSTVLYYILIPGALIPLALRRSPLEFGLRPGKARVWAAHVPPALAVTALVVLAAGRLPSVFRFYGGAGPLSPGLVAERAVTVFAVEFMFRGLILFGLERKLGAAAAVVQMVPFALLHLHKPGLEAAGCVVSGTWFGYLSLRAGSLWPAFAVHLFANLALLLAVGG